MPKPHATTRTLTLIALAAAITAVAPGVALAAPAGAAHAAKKKKPAPLTATVSGTFAIRQDIEGGFGNDNGPNWQKLTVEIKKAQIPFTGSYGLSAAAKATVTFTYHAEASTSDRSWHAGCDSETRQTDGTWTGKTMVSVKESTWLQTSGKSKRYAGWQVKAQLPDAGIKLTSKGSYQDWESILMTNCQTFDASAPLGMWGTGFAEPDGVGRLAADNRSVPLLSIDTDTGQTGSASGRLHFNKAPR
jgi:hypothetical protein